MGKSGEAIDFLLMVVEDGGVGFADPFLGFLEEIEGRDVDLVPADVAEAVVVGFDVDGAEGAGAENGEACARGKPAGEIGVGEDRGPAAAVAPLLGGGGDHGKPLPPVWEGLQNKCSGEQYLRGGISGSDDAD